MMLTKIKNHSLFPPQVKLTCCARNHVPPPLDQSSSSIADLPTETGSDHVTGSGCGLVSLILTPTRELAMQVHAHISSVARSKYDNKTTLHTHTHTLSSTHSHTLTHTHTCYIPTHTHTHLTRPHTLLHTHLTGVYGGGWYGN